MEHAKNTPRKNVPQSIRKSVRMSQFKYLSKSKNLLVFGPAPGQTMMITAANFWHPLKQTDKPDAKLFVKILVIFFCSIGVSNCNNMSLWNQSIQYEAIIHFTRKISKYLPTFQKLSTNQFHTCFRQYYLDHIFKVYYCLLGVLSYIHNA